MPEAVLNDRRAVSDRRGLGRRRAGEPFDPDRRTGADRRRRGERRETPTGHLRNALHVLYGIYSQEALSDEARRAIEAAAQRMWLSLVDVERLLSARAAGAASRRSSPG